VRRAHTLRRLEEALEKDEREMREAQEREEAAARRNAASKAAAAQRKAEAARGEADRIADAKAATEARCLLFFLDVFSWCWGGSGTDVSEGGAVCLPLPRVHSDTCFFSDFSRIFLGAFGV